MDGKGVDFNLSALSDWSLNGFIHSLLDNVSRDMTLDDKYDADFLAKYGQGNSHRHIKGEPVRNKTHEGLRDIFEKTDKVQEAELWKQGKHIVESSEVVTDRELATYYISVRQAEFRKLIRVTDNIQERQNPVTGDNTDISVQKAGTQSLSNVQGPTNTLQKPDPCSIYDTTHTLKSGSSTSQSPMESPTLPTTAGEMVKPKSKKNIFRRIGRWFSRRTSRGKKTVDQ